jgi:hypothetical protein
MKTGYSTALLKMKNNAYYKIIEKEHNFQNKVNFDKSRSLKLKFVNETY